MKSPGAGTHQGQELLRHGWAFQIFAFSADHRSQTWRMLKSPLTGREGAETKFQVFPPFFLVASNLSLCSSLSDDPSFFRFICSWGREEQTHNSALKQVSPRWGWGSLVSPQREPNQLVAPRISILGQSLQTRG